MAGRTKIVKELFPANTGPAGEKNRFMGLPGR